MNITYHQTLKFEIVTELLNCRLATLSEQLGTEESKDVPDAAVIKRLEALMDKNTDQRNALTVTDEAGLDAAIEALANAHDAWFHAEVLPALADPNRQLLPSDTAAAPGSKQALRHLDDGV